MSAHTPIPLLAAWPWALLGLLAGGAFFASLRWLSGALLQRPGATPWTMTAVQALRRLALAALLLAAARHGAAALLALAAGLMAARALLLGHLSGGVSGGMSDRPPGRLPTRARHRPPPPGAAA